MVIADKSITGALSAGTYFYGLLSSKLSVTKEQLQISAFGIKNFVFRPENVIELKKRKFGLQILHNISDYPSFIMFWGNPDKIMSVVKSADFDAVAQDRPDHDDEYQLYTYLFITGAFFLLSLFVLAVVLMILSR
jgi:hypothetical protein